MFPFEKIVKFSKKLFFMFHSSQLFTEKMQYFLFEYFIWECYQSGHGTDAQVISSGGSILSVILTPSLLSSVYCSCWVGTSVRVSPSLQAQLKRLQLFSSPVKFPRCSRLWKSLLSSAKSLSANPLQNSHRN